MDEEQDDVTIEPERLPAQAGDEEFSEEKAEEKIAKMREELKACRQEKQEYMDGWQRAKADYVNAQKRFEGGMKVANIQGIVRAVETLLPAFDAIERAKEHGEIPEGFQAIIKQLEKAFLTLGLTEIGKVGEQFDPANHEAIGQDATDDADKDNTVTTVLEKGWEVGGILIRAAKVRVAHFANKNQEG